MTSATAYSSPADDTGSAAEAPGRDGALRNVTRWWAPVSGVVTMALIFFTMPEWMPDLHFLSPGDGVVVVLYAMLALGMVLVLGYCGQLMLATNAFFGMGAYGLAILAVHQGLDAWLGLLVSVAVVGAAALVVGLLAFRLTGHMLGLVTLAIGYIMFIVFQTAPITGGASGVSAGTGFAIGSLSLAGGTNAFFYLCATASLLSLIAARNLVTSRTGRALRAVQASEPAASATGIHPTRYKVIAFVTGAVMASAAGSLYAGYVGVVGSDSFNILLTIEILLMAVVGGLKSVWGAPLGVLLVVVFQNALQTYGPDVVHISASYFSTIGFGVVLIAVLLFIPGGLSAAGRRLAALGASLSDRAPVSAARNAPVQQPAVQRATSEASAVERPVAHHRFSAISRIPVIPTAWSPTRRLASSTDIRADVRPERRAVSAPLPPQSTPVAVLEARQVTCRFGGLVALDNVNLTLHRGEVLGLIGPNGAGKTTFFNCMSGHVRATSGTVHLDGVDTTTMAPYQIARHGLARTFQNVELFSDMSVLDNVMVGGHLSGRAGAISAMLRLPRHWADEHSIRLRALQALERVGMAAVAVLPAGSLPYGQQRRVDIARALAGNPRVLLLDEPAAGLTVEEAEDLVTLIRDLAAESLSVILVEHNMRALLDAADRVTVLASGRQLITGTPDEVRQDPAVIASYLGTTAPQPATARSAEPSAHEEGAS